MKANNLIIPAFLSFTDFVHASTTPNGLPHDDLPKLKNFLPRQALTTTAALSASPVIPGTFTSTPITTSVHTTALDPRFTTTPHTTETPLPATTTTTPFNTLTTGATPTSTAHNKNHNIAVGYNSTQLTPSTLKNISPGDTLTFYFYPTNYSIIQSSFSSPCTPLSDNTATGTRGIWSGWNPTGEELARSKFVLTIESMDTIWLYGYDGARSVAESASGNGSGKGVCELGMSMVINPGVTVDGSGTLSTYRKRAARLRDTAGTAEEKGKLIEKLGSVPGGGVWGGIVSGVSDKEMGRWEGRHPWPVGGNGTVDDMGSGNGTTDVTDDTENVAGYTNGGVGRVWNGSHGWVGIFVILGVGAFGLGV